MCYSAQIEASYRKFVRQHGALVDFDEYVRIANRDHAKALDAARVPRAVGLAFEGGDTAEEREVAEAFRERFAGMAMAELEELRQLQERLAAAEAKLASAKPTKKAADDQRISTKKIKQAERRIADLERPDLQPSDSRMWPGSYVPVLAVIDGKRVVTPMRYRCRPWFVSEDFERQRPGTYNARMDSLETFWRPLFGRHHGIVLVNSFYEVVDREGKAAEVNFTPQDQEPMIVACLWSDWGEGEGRLRSFAIITDEPPPEVAAAGHDRMIVRIRPEDVDAWLNPDPNNLQALYDIFDRRPRPYYEHRLAE